MHCRQCVPHEVTTCVLDASYRSHDWYKTERYLSLWNELGYLVSVCI